MTSSGTPYLDALSSHLPQQCSSIMASLSSEQARSAVDTLLAFASGGECPKDVSPQGQLEWARKQPDAMRAIQDMLIQKGTKRGRAASTDGEEDDTSSRAVEAAIYPSCLSRASLVPTRGKAKQHWTVVILSSDVHEKGKATISDPHQIIFGLDAISTCKFDTTSYTGFSTPSTSTVTKGDETLAPLREFLTHLPIPVLEASAAVFRNTSRPQHQLHDSSQLLPGSGSSAAAQTQDYSPANIERMSSSVIHGETESVLDDAYSTRRAPSAVGTGAGVSAPHPGSPQSASARGNTAFTSDRPLGV
ncbi:hypothetical protein AZE42_07742 [Rhizopogon vesiculosus]|uniref:Uncharacterized protein n=1 Tax=Rhizopogon vesiculosus TaxID=180088 RepID=A0A1J8QLV5_9AGAM|nr:hypothetical protein AZE42_07742 [Rhizopogon vesiculosus]